MAMKTSVTVSNGFEEDEAPDHATAHNLFQQYSNRYMLGGP